MMMPSISWCGFFCTSSRSLKAPGSDSSALHTRYLSMEPLGMNEAFLPIWKPAPAAAAQPRGVDLADHLVAAHPPGLLERLVAAAAPVDHQRVQAGLVDV